VHFVQKIAIHFIALGPSEWVSGEIVRKK